MSAAPPRIRARGRRLGPIVLVVALVLALAACGGSSSGSTVTVAISSENLNLLPLWLADQQGYYRRAGLTVKTALLSPATTNTAINSNSVEFLDTSPNNFLIASHQGTGQVAILQTSLGIPLGLVVSNRFAAEHRLTKQSSPQAVAHALVGSTGGSASESTTGQTELFLRENGVSTSQMRVATLSSTKAYITALQQGQIDWFSTSEPAPSQAEAQGAGIVVASSQNVAAWSPTQIGIGSLMSTNKEYAQSDPDTVRRFVQATSQALQYVSAHRTSADVVDVAAAALPGVPRPLLTQVIAETDWSGDGAMTPELWATTAHFTSQVGVVPPTTSVAATDWTNDYLE